MSVKSKKHVKRVTPDLKRVVKWVIFPFTVVKQKMTPHKIKRGKEQADSTQEEGQCWGRLQGAVIVCG